MRESQLKALDLPHTAVANTIDLGDIKNIHPKDKLPIGKRLALLATTKAQGPTFKSVTKKGNQLIVHFDHAEGLQTLDGKSPTGFWITDNSAKWTKANAEITNTTVHLSSPELKKPLYIRYAFTGKPDVNLINAAKLPASPFRTDSFKP